ncbi:sulfotransferase 1C2-like [Argopecten irradians]|uniref:sulfotransferase 1C2-like n=1 Tax=Argopecten irradians TaxID=31199 RepID=UPI0037206CE6
MDLKLKSRGKGEGSRRHREHMRFPIYDDCMLPKFQPILTNTEKHMERVRDFDSKDSDILLCTHAKTGAHWVNEIVSMILQGEAEYTKGHKADFMMEKYLDKFRDLPSPRFINTHIAFRHISKKHVENGYFYGGFINYEREWEEAKKKKKAVTNIHSVFYEDLQKNPVSDITRLAAFLNKDLSPQLIEEIADKCSFNNVADAVTSGKKGEDLLPYYGRLEDSVALNEVFDQMLKRDLDDSDLKFTYEL